MHVGNEKEMRKAERNLLNPGCGDSENFTYKKRREENSENGPASKKAGHKDIEEKLSGITSRSTTCTYCFPDTYYQLCPSTTVPVSPHDQPHRLTVPLTPQCQISPSTTAPVSLHSQPHGPTVQMGPQSEK